MEVLFYTLAARGRARPGPARFVSKGHFVQATTGAGALSLSPPIACKFASDIRLCLSSQSQTSFSTQIHALQTELKNAKYELEVQKRAREGQNTRRVVAAPRIDRVANGLVDVQELMGTAGFDEVKVRTFVQGLDGQERMTLMKLVLECTLSSLDRLCSLRAVADLWFFSTRLQLACLAMWAG